MSSKKNALLLVLVAGVCLVVVTPWSAVVNANDDGDYGSAARMAGSGLVDIYVDGVEGVQVRLLSTMTADGTYIATDDTDFGAPNSVTVGFDGPAHGNWKKTGPRQATVVALAFSYDEEGALTTIEKRRIVIDYAKDYQTSDATWTVDVFLPFQDPLDPGDVPAATVSGTATSRLISVE